MIPRYILIHHLLKDIYLLLVFFTGCNIVAAVATPDLSVNCYVCNSGPPSNPNRSCPPSGITAPYLIHNEPCYGRCFIKAHIYKPNVIYRGCTDAYPSLPASLPVNQCHTYADELWCVCVLNRCNRGSLDDLQNPQEEEEEGQGGGIGKPRSPHQVAQRGNTHSKYTKEWLFNLPLKSEQDGWTTPSSNQVIPQWRLKRLPLEITTGKSSGGWTEAYLDVHVTNTSHKITTAKGSHQEQTNETLHNFGSRRSAANHLSFGQYKKTKTTQNVLCVVLVFLFAFVFS